MSRWRAFGIHFTISLAIFLLLLGIIITLWFPGILFSVGGGWSGLRIIVGVDLVLGPLLTLVVFKAGKPGLKFDLACIAIFQAACMVGGLWVVYSERPLALVMAYDTVFSLSADEFADYDRDLTVLEDIPGKYPKLIYTELPENSISADIVAIRSQFIGDPLFIQTERYRAMPQTAPELEAIFRRESNVRAEVAESFLQQLPENCLLSKFASARANGYVCLDSTSRTISEFYDSEVVDLAVQTPVIDLPTFN